MGIDKVVELWSDYFWCDMCGNKHPVDNKVDEIFGPLTVELCKECHKAAALKDGEGKIFDAKRLRRHIIQALIESNNEYEEIAMPIVQRTLVWALRELV